MDIGINPEGMAQMDRQFQVWLKSGLSELALDLSEEQSEQFYQYYEMLTEWNKVMNLTAITEMEQVVFKHFIDSLSLVKGLPELKEGFSGSVLDLGTGAGFPGIPLKIAFPDLRITLLDSLNKRIRFLDAVIEKLNLSHITAIHGRAEDLGRDTEYREQYDICVSRAVANLSTLSEYCLPFVKIKGYFVSYKSGAIQDELEQSKNAVRILGGKIENVVTFQLPCSDAGRSLIKIRKIQQTSRKYPRKAGLPGKEPIK